MPDKPTTVKITIDGQELEVLPGTLVIRAAEQLGTIVPRFCDHRLLAPLGACRQCLVEVAGQRKPLTACTTTVTDGMVVKTQVTSEVARAGQQGNLELLLINHPLDCPMCDKGGECPLQDQTMAHGPGETRFVETKRHYEKPVKISETVLLDRERCVLCARCTRFSSEVAGDPFIELFERGALEQVAIYEDEPYESHFSGNVVQICPVGALTSPSYRFQARPFDLSSADGVCNHCAAGCNLRIDARRGLVTRQLARDNDDVNEAWNCDRGRYGFAYAQSPERVLTPQLSEDGKLRTASWSEALRRAADGIRAAKAKGVGVLVGGHLTDQDAYALQKLARVAFGSNNVDARTWPEAEADAAAVAQVAGRGPEDGMPTYRDLETAKAVVVVDLDPHEESPILWLRLRKAAQRRGVPVVAVGSRPGRLAEFATVVATLPGGQAEALRRLGRAEDDAGRLLREAANAGGSGGEATAPGVVILAGWRGAATGGLAAAARLASSLGARFAWVPRRAGDRGALDVGARPGLLPGGRPVGDAAARGELAQAWGADPPEAPGLDGPAMVSAAAAGELGVLVLAGVDLVRDHGPRELAEQALERAFVVAVDHQVNDTTGRADVLLPGAVYAETEGTFTDWEGRVQASHPAVPVGGAAQAVWELADQLAARLGVDLAIPTLSQVAAETERFRRRPEGGSGGALPAPPAPATRPEPEPAAAQDEQGDSGLALITYPLLLDGASMLARAADLNRETPGAFVELHPEDAGRLGLHDGATAEVDFGEDRTARLPVRVAPTVAPGCAFVPANQPDLALGALLGPSPALRVTVTAVEEAAA
ncbi:MAG TPA: NADH-quinone oxidoreductase subunit G [Actinomycetes bacterium]|jgi:NADH-quinone oxidoreductase subunit G|nr:NADH-quinone oxidoreductase subunit G [Actinomycetes bacterium]